MPWDSTPRDFAQADGKAPGQHRTDGSQGHPVANLEIEGAADDDERTLARIDDDAADPVGSLNGIDFGDQAHHDIFEAFADLLDPLDHESQVIERGGQNPGVVGEGGEVTEPAEWSAHGILSVEL